MVGSTYSYYSTLGYYSSSAVGSNKSHEIQKLSSSPPSTTASHRQSVSDIRRRLARIFPNEHEQKAILEEALEMALTQTIELGSFSESLKNLENIIDSSTEGSNDDIKQAVKQSIPKILKLEVSTTKDLADTLSVMTSCGLLDGANSQDNYELIVNHKLPLMVKVSLELLEKAKLINATNAQHYFNQLIFHNNPHYALQRFIEVSDLLLSDSVFNNILRDTFRLDVSRSNSYYSILNTLSAGSAQSISNGRPLTPMSSEPKESVSYCAMKQTTLFNFSDTSASTNACSLTIPVESRKELLDAGNPDLDRAYYNLSYL